MNARVRVLEALSEVHDPELDEPITSLGFVTSCEVSPDGDVDILLRLPTPQCAPNFAYLMAADARNVVRRLPGVGRVAVRLDDHYTGEEINAAVARSDGFTGALPGETDDDRLEALRELFQRKALLARQARLCEAVLADGATPEQVTGRRVSDLPDVPDTRRCLAARAAGNRPRPRLAGVRPGQRRGGRGRRADAVATEGALVRASLDVNGGICRPLLQIRRRQAAECEEVAP